MILAIIGLGGLFAVVLWYAVGVSGAKHGTPPPPVRTKAVKKVQPEAEKLLPKKIVQIPAKQSQAETAQEDAANQKIQLMIEQVQKMRQEVKQVQGER
ncbi:hypothetical protein HF670_11115 [Acidithiobacillus thiooxidans]|uniref:hypothetical protein n=1 Tax=Acidithiobacillus thiooxidans TaxID=930 RepID=UPI001C071CCF|nr:hypothetical protein [Acidithiobacillus thiooxidans]MBU2840098.1 hypothetical protein [Acidithiobacillus thiooxidans]